MRQMGRQFAALHPGVCCLGCFALVVLLYAVLPGETVLADMVKSLAAGGVVLAALWLLAPFYGDKLHKMPRIGFAACVWLCATSLAAMAFWWANAPDNSEIQNSITVLPVLCVVLSCLGTAVWEEGVFRRILPCVIAGRGSFVWPAAGKEALLAAAVSSLFFAVLHVSLADFASNTGLAFLRLAATFCFAFALCAVVRFKYGLLCAIVTHALFDMIGFIPALMLLQTHSDENILNTASSNLMIISSSPEFLGIVLVLCLPVCAWSVYVLVCSGKTAR